MNRQLIYDLPTRIFHWLFALFFVVAIIIGKTVDDDDLLFSYHMLFGLGLCFLVLFRLFWGVLGTKHARFLEFPLSPIELWMYLKGVLTGDKRKWIGHNPASSWAAILMFALTLGLGISGFLMSSGQSGDELKEIHELMANAFLIVVVTHICGVILHSARHHDGIWGSMFSGLKMAVSDNESPIKPHQTVALCFLLVTLAFSGYLLKGFNPQSRDLNFFGTRLHLAEIEEEDDESEGVEKGDRKEHEAEHENSEREDDDD